MHPVEAFKHVFADVLPESVPYPSPCQDDDRCVLLFNQLQSAVGADSRSPTQGRHLLLGGGGGGATASLGDPPNPRLLTTALKELDERFPVESIRTLVAATHICASGGGDPSSTNTRSINSRHADPEHDLLNGPRTVSEKKEEDDEMYDKKKKEKKTHQCYQGKWTWQPYCDYGAAVVMHNEEEEDMTTAWVVFPSFAGDPTAREHSGHHRVTFASGVGGSPSLGPLKICSEVKPQDLLQALNRKIQAQLAKKAKEKDNVKNHHTPSWLFEVLRITVQQLEKNVTDDDNTAAPLFSKGGTVDVGQHTGLSLVDTVWPVVASLVAFFTGFGEHALHPQKQQQQLLLQVELMVLSRYAHCGDGAVNATAVAMAARYLACRVIDQYPSSKPLPMMIQLPFQRLQQQLERAKEEGEGVGEMEGRLSLPPSDRQRLRSEFQYLHWDPSDTLNAADSVTKTMGTDTLPTEDSWPNANARAIHKMEETYFQLFDSTLGVGDVVPASFSQGTHTELRKYESLCSNLKVCKKGFGGSTVNCFPSTLCQQRQSHVHLMRVGMACLAFEACKTHYETVYPSVAEVLRTHYRLPFDATTLEECFSSLRVSARRACSGVIRYLRGMKPGKQKLFTLTKNANGSFRQLALTVYGADYSCQRRKTLDLRAHSDAVEEYRSKLEDMQKAVRKAHNNVAWATCQTCKNSDLHSRYSTCPIKEAREQLETAENATLNVSPSNIPRSTQDQQLFAFLRAMPTPLKNLCALILRQQKGVVDDTAHLSISPEEMTGVGWEIPRAMTFRYNNQARFEQHVSGDIHLSGTVFFIREGKTGTSFPVEESMPPLPKDTNPFKWMYAAPPADDSATTRAQMPYSEATPPGMPRKTFELLGGVRAATRLQIDKAVAAVMSHGAHCELFDGNNNGGLGIAASVFLSSIAHTAALVDGEPSLFPLFEQLLSRFNNASEMRSLPAVALAASSLYYYLPHDQRPTARGYMLKLAKDVLELIKERDAATGDDLCSTNVRDAGPLQCFLATAALLLFHQCHSDSTATMSEEEVELYLTLRLVARSKEAVNPEQLRSVWHTLRVQLADAVAATTADCWETARDICCKSPALVQRCIAVLDNSVARVVRVAPTPEGEKTAGVVVTTLDGTIYRICLVTGQLLKNGYPLKGLPSVIRSDASVQELFGKDIDLEVGFADGWYRTTNNFAPSLFPDWHRRDGAPLQVYFEFAVTSQSNVIVRYRIRHTTEKGVGKEDDVWTLAHRSTFSDVLCCSFVHEKSHWVNANRSRLEVRGRHITSLQSAELICVLQAANQYLCHKVPKERQTAYLADFTMGPDSDLPNYDVLIPLSLMQLQNSGTEALPSVFSDVSLSHFEYHKFALFVLHQSLQAKSGKRGDKKELRLWLPRCDLDFKVVGDDKGYLESRQNPGYYLLLGSKAQPETMSVTKLLESEDDDSDDLSPDCSDPGQWPHFQLVYHGDEPTHNKTRLVFLNDGNRGSPRQMLSEEVAAKMALVRFDVHDHFQDVRPTSRHDALFLAHFLASTRGSATWIANYALPPSEVILRLLRQCYTNTPLSEDEHYHLVQVVSCNYSLAPSVFLVAETLLRLSKLTEALFTATPNEAQLGQPHRFSSTACRYRFLAKRGVLSQGELLTPAEDEYLGWIATPHQTHLDGIQRQSTTRWSADYLDEVGKDVLRVEQSLFDEFQSLRVEKPSQRSAFPIQHASDSALSKELVDGLKESWDKRTADYSLSAKAVAKLRCSVAAVAKKCECLLDQVRHVPDALNRTGSLNDTDWSFPLLRCVGVFPLVSIPGFSRLTPSTIPDVVPQFNKALHGRVHAVVNWYLCLCVLSDKCKRLHCMLSVDGSMDSLTELDRELRSPRAKIRSRPHWLLFEAEKRIQIRKPQFDTFELLWNSPEHCYTQLNMGEGKTQVIIPLLLLESLHGSAASSEKVVPRVTLLSALLAECRSNYLNSLTFTGSSVPLLEFPFHREVKVQHSTPARMSRLLRFFNGKVVVLQSREHVASMIQQERLADATSAAAIRRNPRGFEFFDIFDEVDELLSPIFRLVYSVDHSVELPDLSMRLRTVLQLLDTLCSDAFLDDPFLRSTLIFDRVGSVEEAKRLIAEGRLPEVQLLPEAEWAPSKSDGDLLAAEGWNETIFNLLSKHVPEVMSIKQRAGQEQTVVSGVVCMTPSAKEDELDRTRRLCLRGFLGQGVFAHCLQRRCNVHYGIPGSNHKKKLAVPYVAADTPSPRSEFSHPDVAVMLSVVAYCHRGLSKSQFQDGLARLVTLPNPSARKMCLQDCQRIIEDSEMRADLQTFVETPSHIDLTSTVQQEQLFSLLSHNRYFVAFWLEKCVFPTDLTQYPKNLSASAWSLADVGKKSKLVGFSGTRDNRWVLPLSIENKLNTNDEIAATDGHMIHALHSAVKDIKCLPKVNGAVTVAERVLLHCVETDTQALIDAGALLAGRSLRSLVQWFASHPQFVDFATTQHEPRLDGITYFDAQRGRWTVYCLKNHSLLEPRTEIPEVHTFIIFDEARCRGADRYLPMDAVALLTVGAMMTKSRLMQAAGRLRKLNRNQKLRLRGLESAFASVPQRQRLALPNILQWTVANEVQANEDALFPFGEQGRIHHSHSPGRPYLEVSPCGIAELYEARRETVSVADALTNREKRSVSALDWGGILCHAKRYGANVFKSLSTLDGECERECEEEQEQEQEQEVEDGRRYPEVFDLSQAVITLFPRLGLLGGSTTTNNFDRTTTCENTKPLRRIEHFLWNESKQQAAYPHPQELSTWMGGGLPRGWMFVNVALPQPLTASDGKRLAFAEACRFNGCAVFSDSDEELLLVAAEKRTRHCTTRSEVEQEVGGPMKARNVFNTEYPGSSLERIVNRIWQMRCGE